MRIVSVHLQCHESLYPEVHTLDAIADCPVHCNAVKVLIACKKWSVSRNGSGRPAVRRLCVHGVGSIVSTYCWGKPTTCWASFDRPCLRCQDL